MAEPIGSPRGRPGAALANPTFQFTFDSSVNLSAQAGFQAAAARWSALFGDNVTINAGAVVENCIIGNNVNISQGCQLMLSVVGEGTFLPFRASLFMTTVMENSIFPSNVS